MNKKFNKQFSDEMLQAKTPEESWEIIKKYDPDELTRNLGVMIQTIGEEATMYFYRLGAPPPGVIREADRNALIE